MTDYNSTFELDYLCVDAPNGKITADRLIRTPGVSPAHLTECVRLAALWPPLPTQRTEAMPGSVGLFRGESVDYILVKAQQGTDGAPRFQYVLTPAAPLRQLAGNWRWFEPFARSPIPESAEPRADLPLLSFSDPPQPASVETQVDDLLALLSFCKNRMPLVRGLVAALVQMMAIGIVNAPLSLTDRLAFVQGLLTLLPAPLRSGITFASSVIDPARTNAQIKFLASDVRPARHLIFDWGAGKLLTDAPDDVYSQFITAQFRLDPALAVEQTRTLERTTAWRMSRKDDLASALAWAARRASLDSALKNGQPGDPKMVAEVLTEDPSLTPELRLLYAKHLLALALSLDEPERTDAIGGAASRYGYVADAVATELQPLAVDPAHAPTVEHILIRWLGANANFDLGASRWVSLLSGAILTRAKPITEGDDPTAIRELLESYSDLPPTLRLERAMAQLIGSSRKAAYSDPDTARAVFLLAAAFLPATGLQRLLADPALIRQLPEPLQVVFPILNTTTTPNTPPPTVPSGLLARASEVYGPKHRPIILGRLIEWALNIQRLDLIDSEALRVLVEVGGEAQGARFDVLTSQIVEDLSRINIIRTLDLRSIQYLVALSLVRGRYDAAITQLEFYQNTLYKGSTAEELLQLVRLIFQETPLTIPQLTDMIATMQTGDLRSVLRAQIYIGIILRHDWSPEVGFAIQGLSGLLESDASLIPVIGVPATLRTIQINVERRDAVRTLKLAAALGENALIMGNQGEQLIERLYTVINWGPEITASALETLRSYVRRAPLTQAKTLTDRMGQQYDAAMSKTLDAAYRLRLLLGNGTFATLADQVTIGAGLLMDMAVTYDESQETPPLHKLYNTVRALSGNLSDSERARLAGNFYRLATQLLQLARLRIHNTSKQKVTALLVQGTLSPTSGVDALRWLGGHFANHRIVKPHLNRKEPPYLFGSRSTNTLLRDTDMLVQLCEALLTAFPEGALPLDNSALQAEVGSVWMLMPPEVQRQTVDKLAENAQLLAELIGIIGDKGNERSLANTGYGRQLAMGRVQPRSVIEVMRWVNGYFMGQHVG